MSTVFAPFTAYFRVTPGRGQGARLEMVRELQRLAGLLYDELVDTTGLTLANPGGGQERGLGSIGGSGYIPGCSIKPPVGEAPAQLAITGFYEISSNTQPYADKTVSVANEELSGVAGGYPWLSGGQPSTTTNSEVVDLKELLDSALSASMPAEVSASLLRLEYKGVTYGERGHHFPR